MGDVLRQINKKDRKCPNSLQSCEIIKNKLRIHVTQWIEIGHITPILWKTITKKTYMAGTGYISALRHQNHANYGATWEHGWNCSYLSPRYMLKTNRQPISEATG
jgi:hypothetical protein